MVSLVFVIENRFKSPYRLIQLIKFNKTSHITQMCNRKHTSNVGNVNAADWIVNSGLWSRVIKCLYDTHCLRLGMTIKLNEATRQSGYNARINIGILSFTSIPCRIRLRKDGKSTPMLSMYNFFLSLSLSLITLCSFQNHGKIRYITHN